MHGVRFLRIANFCDHVGVASCHFLGSSSAAAAAGIAQASPSSQLDLMSSTAISRTILASVDSVGITMSLSTDVVALLAGVLKGATAAGATHRRGSAHGHAGMRSAVGAAADNALSAAVDSVDKLQTSQLNSMLPGTVVAFIFKLKADSLLDPDRSMSCRHARHGSLGGGPRHFCPEASCLRAHQPREYLWRKFLAPSSLRCCRQLSRRQSLPLRRQVQLEDEPIRQRLPTQKAAGSTSLFWTNCFLDLCLAERARDLGSIQHSFFVRGIGACGYVGVENGKHVGCYE